MPSRDCFTPARALTRPLMASTEVASWVCSRRRLLSDERISCRTAEFSALEAILRQGPRGEGGLSLRVLWASKLGANAGSESASEDGSERQDSLVRSLAQVLYIYTAYLPLVSCIHHISSGLCISLQEQHSISSTCNVTSATFPKQLSANPAPRPPALAVESSQYGSQERFPSQGESRRCTSPPPPGQILRRL